jgi:hypothetical protein
VRRILESVGVAVEDQLDLVFTGLEGRDLAELSAAGRKRFMLCKKLKSEIHITDASQVILFDMVNGDVPASAKRKPDLVEDNKEAQFCGVSKEVFWCVSV